jgi:hypothetical protein
MTMRAAFQLRTITGFAIRSRPQAAAAQNRSGFALDARVRRQAQPVQ